MWFCGPPLERQQSGGAPRGGRQPRACHRCVRALPLGGAVPAVPSRRISDRETPPVPFKGNPSQEQSCVSKRGQEKACLVKNQLKASRPAPLRLSAFLPRKRAYDSPSGQQLRWLWRNLYAAKSAAHSSSFLVRRDPPRTLQQSGSAPRRVPPPRPAAVPQPPALRYQDGAAAARGFLPAPAAPRDRSAAASGGRRLRARLVRGDRAAAGPGQRHGAWGREGRGREGTEGTEGFGRRERRAGAAVGCRVLLSCAPRSLAGRAFEIRVCERRLVALFPRELRGAVRLRLLGLRYPAAPRGPGCTSGSRVPCVSAARRGTSGCAELSWAVLYWAVLSLPWGRPEPSRLGATAGCGRHGILGVKPGLRGAGFLAVSCGNGKQNFHRCWAPKMVRALWQVKSDAQCCVELSYVAWLP